jgi:glyoxylase-like metal-dependent hydrolase (beta-lactamase superfamily II)
MKIPCLVIPLLAIGSVAFAQGDLSKVEIKSIPVAKNIYMLEGSGGNIGVSVGEDGILIVDDQYAPLADKIEAALKGLNPGKLKYVLNTHHHGDQFVNGFPFVDFSSGGNVDGFVKTVATVLEKIPTDAKIIPGHGKLSTYDDLKNYHSILVDTIQLVRKQISEGKSLDEVKAAGLPEKYKNLGTGFSANRWIEAIHRGTPKK